MANYVKIATIGPIPPRVKPDMKPQEIVDFMIEHWREKFAQVLPDKPDLIVVCEACDRASPDGFPLERRMEYYRVRGHQVRDMFAETAKQHGCYIVYSASRQIEDGTWRNSSVIIDRSGNIAGTYNKNHLVIEETTQAGILCGKDAPLIECDFGKIACAICFDLNFDELRLKYAQAKPDLIVFSSMYHGGDLVQGNWAYSCRSHFVGAIAGPPSQIRNPFGQVVASSTNYRDYTTTTVNLDCCIAHIDYNHQKFQALKAKYGPKVEIHDPCYIGSVLITSHSADISAAEMVKEFEIELLDDYFTRALAHHHDPKNIEN